MRKANNDCTIRLVGSRWQTRIGGAKTTERVAEQQKRTRMERRRNIVVRLVSLGRALHMGTAGI
jgi:hypothetical protein